MERLKASLCRKLNVGKMNSIPKNADAVIFGIGDIGKSILALIRRVCHRFHLMVYHCLDEDKKDHVCYPREYQIGI